MVASEQTATLTTEQLRTFLRRRHANAGAADRWVYYEELATGTGNQKKTILDAWAMDLWPSANFSRITYEIKCSRSDYLRELAAPQKRKLGLLYSNEFYFVTPRHMLRPAELPPECGLIECDADGRCYTPVAAPWRDMDCATWAFVASLLREAQWLADRRVEAKIVAQFETREQHLRTMRENLDDRERQLREAEARLRAEWEQCKEVQRAAGMTPRRFL